MSQNWNKHLPKIQLPLPLKSTIQIWNLENPFQDNDTLMVKGHLRGISPYTPLVFFGRPTGEHIHSFVLEMKCFKAEHVEVCTFPNFLNKTMFVFTSQKQSYRPWDPANQKTGSTKHELLSSMPICWRYKPSVSNHPSSQQKIKLRLRRCWCSTRWSQRW